MSQNTKVNILDASWLALDTEDTPMHVGNLQILSLPDDAPDNFLRDQVHNLKSAGEIVDPWNKKLTNPSFLGRLLAPSWLFWSVGRRDTPSNMLGRWSRVAVQQRK